MVRWYDPGQLLSTGVEVLIATAMGQRSDYRLMEDTADQDRFSYATWDGWDDSGFCFDYMADTGDGWNSTHAMAALIAEPSLTVGSETLPRGRFLVLGGDQVYPVATQKNYEERLVIPFETAFPEPEPPRPRISPARPQDDPNSVDLYAIPGNHDWYDGLTSFLRIFGQGRPIGVWHTAQRRSYFAALGWLLPAVWG
jgi:hypothetical protein